jgi:hypothetical protein
MRTINRSTVFGNHQRSCRQFRRTVPSRPRAAPVQLPGMLTSHAAPIASSGDIRMGVV